MTETGLVLVWLGGFGLIYFMFFLRKEWLWKLIGSGLMFINAVAGWYLYDNQVTMVVALISFMFFVYNMTNFLVTTASKG